MTFLEYHFVLDPIDPVSDILAAELGELGFESFKESDKGLLAYILKEKAVGLTFDTLFVFQNPNFQISWSVKSIEQQNWNAEWEKNFHPIKIKDYCVVRAPFHDKEKVTYDIVIEPKMSFGTGHHETTHMMLEHLLEADLSNKKVLDMGCGTGVLAILAKMRGAVLVHAIDIDEWCYLNTKENTQRNGVSEIKVTKGGADVLSGGKYDIILANINRNVLLEDIPVYAKNLERKGELYLSGFYNQDLSIISSKCEQYNLEFRKSKEKNNWISAKYVISKYKL